MRLKNHLTTTVKVPDFSEKIRHNTSIFLSGSCFTEHIAEKLERYKYHVLSNPFGILYNPVSLARSIERIVNLELFQKDELVFHQGLYHSMDHHGSFSSNDEEDVLKNINESIQSAHDRLKSCSFAFISPGTARAYRYKETQAIVGNCHKLPGASFSDQLLSVSECESAFAKIYSAVKSISPQCHIIWTISPVRHLKDGLVENQQSKAALILGVMEIMNKHEDTGYFPAYEIMIDELRDYRYYNRDMTHPSPLAIDIIWDTFQNAYIHADASEKHAAIEKVKRAMEHRILHENKVATQAFAEAQIITIDQLQKQYPDLSWEQERSHFEALIEK
jgi:hypothetical protein